MKIIRKALSNANKLEEGFVVFIFCVMLASSFAQVLNRNIFQLPIGWFEELARYSQVYLALLAMELGLRDGSQMSLTVFIDKLPERVGKVAAIIAKGIVVAFSLILCVKSIELIRNLIASGQRSPGLKIAMYIPYFALPLSFSIASLVQSFTLIKMMRELFSGRDDKEVSA